MNSWYTKNRTQMLCATDLFYILKQMKFNILNGYESAWHWDLFSVHSTHYLFIEWHLFNYFVVVFFFFSSPLSVFYGGEKRCHHSALKSQFYIYVLAIRGIRWNKQKNNTFFMTFNGGSFNVCVWWIIAASLRIGHVRR